MENVESHVTLPVDLDEAWRLVTDPDELSAWLGDEIDLEPVPGAVGEIRQRDGGRRHVFVESVDAGRSISWYWWSDEADGGDGVVSRVRIAVSPDRDGSRVAVVEELVPARPQADASASVSTRIGAWSYRLFALEVRCLAVSTAALIRA